jgi:hypothetical protein
LYIKLFFLNFCTVFVVSAASAQLVKPSLLRFSTYSAVKKKPFTVFSINNAARGFAIEKPSKPSIRVIAPDFYTAGFGFFCRQELKFEKITNIPFRFRLGSVAACDRLEGKRVSITQ